MSKRYLEANEDIVEIVAAKDLLGDEYVLASKAGRPEPINLLEVRL